MYTPFKFGEMWTRDQGCEGVVDSTWRNSDSAGTPMFTVAGKVWECETIKDLQHNAY